MYGEKKTGWPAWAYCPTRHPEFDSLSQTLRPFFLALNYPSPTSLIPLHADFGLALYSPRVPPILEFFH